MRRKEKRKRKKSLKNLLLKIQLGFVFYYIIVIAFISSFFANKHDKANKNKNFDSALPLTCKYCKQNSQVRINNYISCKLNTG